MSYFNVKLDNSTGRCPESVEILIRIGTGKDFEPSFWASFSSYVWSYIDVFELDRNQLQNN